MKNVQIYLKGWHDTNLYVRAVNDKSHRLHDEAWALRDQMFLPYQPGHVVHLAFEYVDEDPDALDSDVRNRAFEWFNVGENAIAQQYRAKRNRSLSVGDVVVVDGRASACAPTGWTRLDNFEPTIAER